VGSFDCRSRHRRWSHRAPHHSSPGGQCDHCGGPGVLRVLPLGSGQGKGVYR